MYSVWDKVEALVSEDEDNMMVVLAVREELLLRVWTECYRKYMDRQTIAFLVDCAHCAWQRIIDLEFYHHDQRTEQDELNPRCQEDGPPTPAVSDTWLARSAPLRDKIVKQPIPPCNSMLLRSRMSFTNDEPDYASLIQVTIPVPMHSATSSSVSTDVLDAPLSGMLDDATIDGQMFVPNPSMASSYADGDLTGGERSDSRRITIGGTQVKGQSAIIDVPSFFTLIATANSRRDGVSAVMSRMSAARKFRKDHRAKLPKLTHKTPTICNETQHPNSVAIEALPPIRATTSFKYHVTAPASLRNGKDQHKK